MLFVFVDYMSGVKTVYPSTLSVPLGSKLGKILRFDNKKIPEQVFHKLLKTNKLNKNIHLPPS